MFNLERKNYKKNIRNLYYTMCDVCLCACVGVGVCLCVGMAERLTAIPPMLATVRERRLASDQESTNQPAHKRTWMGGDGVVRPNGGRTLPTRTPTIASIAPNTIAASMHPKRLTFIYIYICSYICLSSIITYDLIFGSSACVRSTVEEKEEEEVVDVCMELLPATHVVLHLMEYVHMCVWMCVDVMSWVPV